MKTVPTLCATATVVGVSAAGLSLGRPEPSPKSALPPQSQPPHLSPHADEAIPPNPDRVPTRPLPSRPYTSSATPQTAPASDIGSTGADPASRPLESHQSYEKGTVVRRPRRMTAASSRPQSQQLADRGAGAAPGEGRDGFEATASLRRPSWVKRLSFVSSHTSSVTPSPQPSPSWSYSNWSMAFSHDGSTAPIVGNPPPLPLPPNKLVKRSSSLRHAGAPERRPVLRRPSTSHQRSATLQARPTFMDVSPAEIESHCAALSPREPPEVRWRQYFSTKANRPEIAKKCGLTGEAAILKRIKPNEKHFPTLLLAGAVKAPVLGSQESFSQYGDSEDGRSRPQTPVALDEPLSNPAAMPVTSPPIAETLAPPETIIDETRSRRSFTINDILGTIPQPKKFRASNGRSSGNRLVRKLGLRSESDSRPSTFSDDIATANEESRRSTFTSKRDIGDFRFSPRELYSSQSSRNAENEPPALKGHSRPFSAPVPPIPPIPSSYASNPVRSPVSPVFPQPLPAAPYSRPCSGRPSSPPVTRPSRNSTAPSEQASTLVGSDLDGRGVGSGEDDDTDYQSETVFDSLRTRGTRSITGGSRGPRIETIFDESPPPIKSKVSALRDLLPKGTFLDAAVDLQGAHAITEEEESVSTPMRTPGPERRGGSPTPGPRSSSRFSTDIPSSPPDLRKPLSLGTLEWDTAADGEDDGRWSFNDDESEGIWDVSSHQLASGLVATPLSLLNRSHPTLVGAAASSPGMPLAPHWAATGDHADRDARSSIFDWSEPPADQSSGNRTPPRPKTVHGKKDADGRGSRALGRRVPSGLHARSQSVPVVPVLTNKRDTVITNKFGTWGVGSKGVTEDWNDDFDFTGPTDADHSDGDEKRVDSASSMVVPQTIKEQQTNVLANIGLLKEWGLLIEELKDLRARGASLEIIHGPYLGMWQEVDAMIDLADQEVDDPAIIPHLSPPSSPGFDADAFDEPSTNTPNSGRTRARSILQVREGLDSRASPVPSSAARACRRKSILNTTDDIFSSPALSHKTSQNMPAESPSATRPRKNSEAVARSVIEALQNRKSTLQPLEALKPVPAAKKVPFDTATLKHIVPYVNGLTRKCKEALRETERLYSSPTQSPKHDLGISQIFRDHPDGSPSSRKSRQSRSNNTTNGSLLNGESLHSKENDLVAHMKLLTVM